MDANTAELLVERLPEFIAFGGADVHRILVELAEHSIHRRSKQALGVHFLDIPLLDMLHDLSKVAAVRIAILCLIADERDQCRKEYCQHVPTGHMNISNEPDNFMV
jgi:hypothetical protein